MQQIMRTSADKVKWPLGMTLSVISQIMWGMQQCAFVLRKIVVNLQPGQFALVVHMEGGLEVGRVFE